MANKNNIFNKNKFLFKYLFIVILQCLLGIKKSIYISGMKINFPAIIITSIAAYAIPKIFGAKDFIDQLKIELKSVVIEKDKIKASQFKKLFWTINLVVINPVNFSVTIDAILMDIYINGQKLAQANTTKKYKIEAQKKIIIPVLIGFTIDELPQSIYSIITDAIKENNIKFLIKGQMNFKEASIKFTFNETVEI